MSKALKALRIGGRVLATVVPLALVLAVLRLIIAWLAGAFESKIAPGRAEAIVDTLSDQPTDIVHEITKSYIEEAIGTLKAASRSSILVHRQPIADGVPFAKDVAEWRGRCLPGSAVYQHAQDENFRENPWTPKTRPRRHRPGCIS